MRERYIQADIREDAMLAGIVRTEHLKYVLAATAVGVLLFILPFPLLLRFFFLLFIPGVTAVVLFLRLDQAIFRWRKYRKISNKVSLDLLKDYKPPSSEDIEIKYENGVRGVLLAVSSINRELTSDDEKDRDADSWADLCRRLHKAGVSITQITDWVTPPIYPELDYLENKYRNKHANSVNLNKALKRVDYYRTLVFPQAHYHILLSTWNSNVNLAKEAREMIQAAKQIDLSMEILSAQVAIRFSHLQMAPFGERSSIDEEIIEDTKWVQLLKIWSNTIDDMKTSKENRLIQKKKPEKKKQAYQGMP